MVTSVILVAVLMFTTRAEDKNEIPAVIEKSLRDGKKMEVMYLDGTIAKKESPAFHDYTVIGVPIEVDTENKRKQIIDAIVKDVADGSGGSKEFKASHGIRITSKDGKVIDVLIGDSWLFIFVDERKDLRIKNESIKVLDSLKKR